MDAEKLKLLYELAIAKMDMGDLQGALDETRKMKAEGDCAEVAYMMSGMLIDIGFAIGDESLMKEGIELLEKYKDTLILNEIIKSSVFFNLGNGYLALFCHKYRKDRLTGYFKESDLDKAKTYLLEAVNQNDSNRPSQTPEMWTNLGNCFDHFGRVVDALECYDYALKLFPEHSMAMCNKGIALSYYARLVGDHEGTFLNEAYHLISKALELGVTYESKNTFQFHLKEIENSIPDKEKLKTRPNFPGIKVEGDSDMEIFLKNFCLKNKLYLNICNVCQKCTAAVGDTLSIKFMIVNYKSQKQKNDPFLRLSSYLNQIKQDYVTARFLFVLSRYKGMNLGFVDKRVKITDTLDFNIPNIRTHLLKHAYKSFFDILDKAAIFINNYLKLGMQENRISFMNIWYSNPKKKEIHEKMLDIKNYSLNAIFDIYREIAEGRHKKLRSIRNAITHRFFNVNPITKKEDDENTTEENFVNHTIELAKIVRNSLIYLVNFVYLEEKKKDFELNGKRSQIRAHTIPDELKH